MTDDEIRDLLHEMRDDPVPADSLARVRLGVAERIQPRDWARIFSPWKLGASLLAVGCVVWIALLVRPAPQVSRPTPPVVAHQVDVPLEKPAPPPVVAQRRKAPPTRRVLRQVRQIEKAPEVGGAAVIRIETPDPDVVILLIGD